MDRTHIISPSQAGVVTMGAVRETDPVGKTWPIARQLAQIRRSQTSVIGNCATPSTAEFEHACRALDVASAYRCIQRLIGWGEGLTPAGDDYLVGVRAALAALARGDDRRLR